VRAEALKATGKPDNPFTDLAELPDLEIAFEPDGVPHVTRKTSAAGPAQLDAVLTHPVDDPYARPAAKG
jgi:hypothetical protein